MWSTEIENILLTSKNFLGCFPMNELPPFPHTLPSSLIVNTDISTGRGEHWLGLVLTKNKCFYFDSFGAPIIEDIIISYLQQKYTKVIINNECIQHTFSTSCGLFCIAFIKYVKTKSNFETFISRFNLHNVLDNDKIVLSLI